LEMMKKTFYFLVIE